MTKSVLLIDENASARGMLRFALELHGYRVAEVKRRADASAVVVDGQPALLVIGVDHALAGNCDLIGEVRGLPGLSNLPVLLVGEEHCASRWDLRAIGNCAWLSRPFHLGDVPRLIENLLGGVSASARSSSRQ